MNNEPESENVLICGNGPSFTQIDYSLLPKDFDVFRVNQFYLEDKYYLGKKIKVVFIGNDSLEIKLFTYKVIHYKDEYNIDEYVVADIFQYPYKDNIFFKEIEVKLFSDVLKTYPSFMNYCYYTRDTYNKIPTTGISAILYAVHKGYKNIYIAGIDFYQGKHYPFSIGKEISKIYFENKEKENEYHSFEIDIKALEMIKEICKEANCNLFSITHNSSIVFYIPMASISNLHNNYLSPKKYGYIKDFLLPDNVNHKLIKEYYKSKKQKKSLFYFIRSAIRILSDKTIEN